jgi:fluoride exporter
LSARIIGAVFLGGAIGSALRYLIFLGVEQASFTEPKTALVATTIVNLLGASFLGFVQATSLSRSDVRNSFWGSGLAGGFTTMSGLSLVTNSQDLGAFGNGTIFWAAVALQLILGVLAYWLGRTLGGQQKLQNLFGGKS